MSSSPTHPEQLVLAALADYKAQEIVLIDVRARCAFTDYIVICTATSTRHALSIADYLLLKAKEADIDPIGVEGTDTGEWVLVDLGDAVIHVMLAETRKFYSLEKLWRL